MAKKKTSSKKNPEVKAQVERVKELAAEVNKLFVAESDGDTEALANLIKERLLMTKAQYDRVLSGDELPSAEKIELLEGLLTANSEVSPGEPIKPREEPTKHEVKQIERVKSLHDLTRHPEWSRFAESLRRKELAMREDLVVNENGKANQKARGTISAIEWVRDSILAPVDKLVGEDESAPLFQSGLKVEVDRESLLVTVSAR